MFRPSCEEPYQFCLGSVILKDSLYPLYAPDMKALILGRAFTFSSLSNVSLPFFALRAIL